VAFASLLVIPYAVSYAAGGMWVFERCYRQQADVQYKHDLIIVTSGYTAGGGGNGHSWRTWSTSEEYNKLAQEQLRIPTIRSYEEDQNRDGMNDMLHLEMEVPLSDKEMMQGVSILLMFDYRLHNMASVSMEAAAYFEYSNGVPGSSLFVDGDLTLKQREALPWFGQRTTYEEPIVNMNSYNADDYDLSTIMTNYLSRNETTDFVPRATVWRGDRATGEPFKLTMNVRYPEQRICYRPGFWQELKVGWVQYLSILVPAYMIASWAINFIFVNRLVDTVISLPVEFTKGTKSKTY